MRKFYLQIIVCVLANILTAQSPISLGNSNMPDGSDTLRYTNVQLSSVGNYTQTGVNFNWDFRSVVSTTEGRRDFKLAQQTPYGFFFLLSSNVYGEKITDTLVSITPTITMTNYYNFYKKQTTPSNAFVADAMGLTISGITVPAFYSDKDEFYFFPLSYPQRDSSRFKFSTPTTSLLPIKYSQQGYRITEVDGWGTVTTPYGTENCLRLVTTKYSLDTTIITLPTNTLFPITLPPLKFGIQNYQRSYQWLTLNSKIPYFEVSGNVIAGNFTATNARYRGFTYKSYVGLNESESKESMPEVYPNPVKDVLQLNTVNHQTKIVRVIDMNGKLIMEEAIKEELNVSRLEKGIYLLLIQHNDTFYTSRFIKE